MSRPITRRKAIALASVIFAVFCAGCGVAPAIPENTSPTDVITMLQQTPSQTKTPTARRPEPSTAPIRTEDMPTLPLPTASAIHSTALSETPTIKSTGAFPETVLSSFIPTGAIARFGRGVINQMVAAPDGKTVAVGGAAGLFLYRSDDFQELWSIPTTKGISEITYSADGSTLAAALPCNFYPTYAIQGGQGPMCSDLPQILILNPATGSVQRNIFPVPSDPGFGGGDIMGIGLSADGKILFLGMMYEGVSAWDTISGSRLRDYPLPTANHSFMDSIAFSPEGTRFSVAFENGTIEILGLADGGLIQTLSGMTIYRSVQTFSPDGTRIAVGWGDQIAVWNISKGVVEYPFVDPKGNISTLTFSSDGSRLISGDGSGTVIVWDTLGGHCRKVFSSLGEVITGTASLSEGKNFFATTQRDVVLWEFSTGKLFSLPEFGFSNWTDAQLVSGGSRLILAVDSNLHYWTPDGGTYLGQLEYPEWAVFSGDYTTYAVITPQMEIQFYDLTTGKLLHSMRAPEYLNSKYGGPFIYKDHFVFSPDQNTVAIIGETKSGSDSFSADLWNIMNGQLIHTFEGVASGSMDKSRIIFSPDGKLAALGIFDGLGEFGEGIWIFRVESGEKLGAVGNYSQLIFTLSMDDRWIASGCDGREHQELVCIYNVQQGEFVSAFTTDIGDDMMTTIGISPNSRALAMGTKWGQVILWDTASSDLLKVMKGQAADVTSLAFSPDGKTLASTSKDGTVVLWDLTEGK